MLFKKLFYLIVHAVAFANATCYWPNGAPAAGYTSCGDDTSQCCSVESICLTNGYCISTVFSFNLSRATCKDKKWKSCKNPCKDGEFHSVVPQKRLNATNLTCSLLVTDREDGGCALPFYGTIDGEALYCPDSIVPNATGLGCADGTEPFSVRPASIITNKAALSGAYCAVDPINPKIDATQAATATQSAFPTATNNSMSSCSPDSEENSSSEKVAIGAGVGVPLGVVSLITIAWALFERKKRYQMINSPPPQPVVMQQAIPQTTPQELADTPRLGGSCGIQELEAESRK